MKRRRKNVSRLTARARVAALAARLVTYEKNKAALKKERLELNAELRKLKTSFSR